KARSQSLVAVAQIGDVDHVAVDAARSIDRLEHQAWTERDLGVVSVGVERRATLRRDRCRRRDVNRWIERLHQWTARREDGRLYDRGHAFDQRRSAVTLGRA